MPRPGGSSWIRLAAVALATLACAGCPALVADGPGGSPADAVPPGTDGQPGTTESGQDGSVDGSSVGDDDVAQAPDDAPAISDDAPAISDDAPAIPDDAPAIPDDAPAISDDAPAIPDDAPAIPDDAPAIPDDAPAIPDDGAEFGTCSATIADGPSGPASPAIPGALGFSDVSPHQVVRSRANVLYAIVPTCNDYPECTGNELRAWKGDAPATPTAMVEVDATHRPAGGAGSTALALDGCDRVHVLWNTRDGSARYAVLDAATDAWGPASTLAATGWTDYGQGDEGVALAVDAAGVPHAAWGAVSDGVLHLFFATLAAGAWSAPERVDDVPLSGGRRTWHPTLAFAPDGSLLLAWLEGSVNYVPDGVIRLRRRAAAGTWAPSVALPDAAMTAIDNGPSLIVTPDGVAHLSFDNTGNQIRYWYDDGSGWKGDRQPPAQVTHDPALGPDGHGGIYIWGHGAPTDGTLGGNGPNLYRFHRPAGGTWGAFDLYVQGAFDSSVTTRWSQFFHHFPAAVDIAFWDPGFPNRLFLGTD